MKFLSPEVALYRWNVVMFGLVLLFSTWNCWISYKNGYAGLLVFHLLPFLNPCLIVKVPAYVLYMAITLVNVHLNWLNWFHLLILQRGLFIILVDSMFFLLPFLNVTKMWISSFFPHTASTWNSLPIECFPSTYHLNGFKSKINRHLLLVGSFLHVLIFLCFFLL